MAVLEETHRLEREKWDALAGKALAGAELELPWSGFEEYARSTATLASVPDFLGDLRGKRVLEYGCGLGMITTLLAKSGAHVSAFDLSPLSVETTLRRAEANGVLDRVEVVAAPGEELPYDDESFDVVFGKAILHHLDVERAGPELLRIVRPGGRAAFVEPMGMNPLLNLARAGIPYPHKNPRGEDRPLKMREIEAWERGFGVAEREALQLLSMLERGLGFRRPLPALRRTDALLLRRMPFLWRYCRYLVMRLVK